MTPKEKAEELVKIFLYNIKGCTIHDAKKAAEATTQLLERQEGDLLGYKDVNYSSEYWQEVKQETKK